MACVLMILFAVRGPRRDVVAKVCPPPTAVLNGTVVSGSLTFEGVTVAAVWYALPFQYLTTAS